MERAFISRANFRLAHLLLDRTVTNLVVTTNFDDFLSRALTLFGRRHIVCDHPRTLERIDLRSQDVQIVHIHGSYWFYDCCNLKAEISERAKGSSSTSFTMLSTLDEILRTRSPLVVGYSGWEGDVFMNALQRRMSAPLRTNLYWFCYTRRDAQSLPDWLRNNPNVCSVEPDEPRAMQSADSDLSMGFGTAKAHGSTIRSAETGTSSTAERDEAVIQATAVFDELILRFKLVPPPLTKDPLGFFSKHLTDSLLGDKPEEVENDVYAIRGVVARLLKYREEERYLPPRPQSELRLESFRNAVRQSDHRLAIRLAGEIPLGDLKDEELREVGSALSSAASALDDNSAEELRSYDLIIATMGRLEELGQYGLAAKMEVGKALVSKGATLGALNRSEEAISVYDEVVRRFGDATESALREWVVKALVNKGFRLGVLNRSEDAIGVYDEAVRRFGDATEPASREGVAKALYNKGCRLGILNCNEDSIGVYDELVRRFGEATESALRRQVAKALVNKGVALGALNRSEDAIGVYDEVVRRFGDAIEPELREPVAAALRSKGFRLGVLNRSEDAIGVYDELVRRFGEATEPALREQVAKAMAARTGLAAIEAT